MGPRAEKKAHSFTKFGKKINDPYFWLKEKENPEVLRLLEKENEFFQSKIKPLKSMTNVLFKELKARIPEADDSVPVKRGDAEYFFRFKKGSQYYQYCRIKNKKTDVLLDLNKLVGKNGYLVVGSIETSRDGKFLAYTIDNTGTELYDLVIFDLTKKVEVSRIKNTHSNFVWSNVHMVFYMTIDGHLRADKVWRHIIGQSENDRCIFTEKEKRFFTSIEPSSSRQFLIISTGEQISSYASYLPLDSLDEEAKVFSAHKEKIEYSIDHIHNSFFICTNEKAMNFQILECNDNKIAKKNWSVFVPHNAKILIKNFALTENFLVSIERSGGLPKIRIFDLKNKKSKYVKFLDDAYVFSYMSSFESADNKLRINYHSPIRPETIIDIDLHTIKQKVRKVNSVKGFNTNKYIVEFVFVKSHDGQKIPMCITYKKNLKLDGKNPGIVYSYGSYGSSMYPGFQSNIVSLLDRGFVYADVGVRGGSDLGRHWYENGKFLKKKNTFLDFITCTEYLVKKKYISKDRIAAEGVSAGGMLMGAITNLRPDLYKVICAHVPFVDVINTMFDTSLPLTTVEYNEWGNPNQKKFFDYMLSYSPYDNVVENYFPNIYATAGLNDQRVTYWEPAKWVQKLRDHNLGENDIILKVNMGEGHFGKSGRYNKILEEAEQYSYLIEKLCF
jgi:oligopeptidase B